MPIAHISSNIRLGAKLSRENYISIKKDLNLKNPVNELTVKHIKALPIRRVGRRSKISQNLISSNTNNGLISKTIDSKASSLNKNSINLQVPKLTSSTTIKSVTACSSSSSLRSLSTCDTISQNSFKQKRNCNQDSNIFPSPKKSRKIDKIDNSSPATIIREFLSNIKESSKKVDNFIYYDVYSMDRNKEKIHCNGLNENIVKNIPEKLLKFRWLVVDTIMRIAHGVIHDIKIIIRRSTVHLAIALLDRFLASNGIQRLLGNVSGDRIASCVLHIVMKMEEIDGQSFLRRFKKETQMGFLISLEQKVLSVTESIVDVPLAVDFSHFLMAKLGYKMNVIDDSTQLTAYLLDLFCYSSLFMYTPPSLAAAAAVKLMRHICEPRMTAGELWPKSARQLTGYSASDLSKTMKEMNRILMDSETIYSGAMMLHRGGWAEIAWIK